jgi:hypothetical protein
MKASDNQFPKLIVAEVAAPATPASGLGYLYEKTDGALYFKNDAGTETNLSTALTNPMTTAGDIIYGGASGVATRLALGAVGGAVSRINGAVAWNSGTSNPGAAVSGDRYWRSDLSREIFYDGTRWLTTTEFALPLPVFSGFPPYSANGNDLVAATDMAHGGMWVTRLTVTTVVLTTNDGSRYWNFQLASFDGAVTQHNLGSSVNTSAATAGTYTKLTATIGAAVTSGDVQLRIVYSKTSTPGNMYANGLVHYRLVVT